MATSRSRAAGPSRRWRTLGLLAVLAVAMVPAAIAWACNPQAYLNVPPTVQPGSAMPISGAFFKGDRPITVSIENGSSVTVTTSSNGSFSTTLTAPTAPGGYSVSAVGYEPDGTLTAGLPARASFSVAAAGTAGTGSPSTSGTPTQSGASPGTTQSGSTAPRGGRFAEPETPTTRAFARARGGTPGGEGRSNRGSSGAGDVGSGGGVVTTSAGTPVFAGSVARSERVAIVSGRSPSAGRKGSATASANPSARSVGSDIWSGFASAKAPSLLDRESGARLEGGAGSQLGWGIGLAGLGLLALGLGLAVVARRRRATAR